MSEARTSPLVLQIVLLVAFLAIVATAVVTVLWPDLQDEPEPAVPGATSARDAGSP